MNAVAMVETCARYQNVEGIVPDLGRAPDEPPVRGDSLGLGVIDRGIEGHAGERAPHEDRRDDGTPLNAP